jgi:hypothetical protein
MMVVPCKEMSVKKCAEELIDTCRVNMATDSLDNNLSVNAKGIGLDYPVSLINDIDIGDSTVKKILVQATKGQYCFPLDQFHGKDRSIRLKLIDEVLEDTVLARTLDTQSHDTIIWAYAELGPFRHSAESLSRDNERANPDSISVEFSGGAGPISKTKFKFFERLMAVEERNGS